ncbi:hypothetical protein GH733_017883 [Mirounga leonina]|nr:hypothetical protein GH733_017883 [Mirounga leonina]
MRRYPLCLFRSSLLKTGVPCRPLKTGLQLPLLGPLNGDESHPFLFVHMLTHPLGPRAPEDSSAAIRFREVTFLPITGAPPSSTLPPTSAPPCWLYPLTSSCPTIVSVYGRPTDISNLTDSKSDQCPQLY